MSSADLVVIVFQIVLPVMLLVWLCLAPARCVLLYLLQLITTVLYMLALCYVPIWLVPPWWTPWAYLAAAALIIAGQCVRKNIPDFFLPPTLLARLSCVVLAVISIGLTAITVHALSGRKIPGDAIELAFPLAPGTYLVVNGGSTSTVNAHFLTLKPKTDRQRRYRGQSYAVDLIGLGAFGMRASGWRPRDPAAYSIFGSAVYAPCSGKVLSTRNDRPDMRVPDMDACCLEGNHVFLECGEFGVLLAHFRHGSLHVSPGDHVATGDQLGEVGNSGQTGEPHLHIHTQRIPAAEPLFSGEPLFMTLDGQFPVRNQRISYSGGSISKAVD